MRLWRRLAVALVVLVSALAVYNLRGWNKAYELISIPLIEYASVFVLALIFALGLRRPLISPLPETKMGCIVMGSPAYCISWIACISLRDPITTPTSGSAVLRCAIGRSLALPAR